ncbi:MAG: hypothetical protein ABIR27_11850 [Dokdonella sp.]
MSDLDRLRLLLLDEERTKLALAEQRISELERVNSQLAALLPDLVTAAPREPMSRALATPVAAALGNAVHENRASIVDALFPVIGPIIRKAIAEALRGLMRDMNTVLEHGFSPRGIRWRIEAWRSGVPFAQIVLKHSLRYQIDHVFLIERDSGLVLHRESSPGLPDLDADAIAGMLTAIGQFVRDSVGRDGGDSLEAARVGKHLLWVIDGPRASLACFIQGVPPDALRVVLSDRLEQIHSQLAASPLSPDPALASTSLDLGNSLNPIELVAASAAMSDEPVSERRRPARWPMVLIFLILVLGLGWHFLHKQRWNKHVYDLRSQLVAHPGFLLTDLESKPWSRLIVHGLIDAEADPIEPLIDAADFGEIKPTLELDGYLSTDDAIVLKRASRLLDAPADVRLAVIGGVLQIDGTAAASWIDTHKDQAAWVAGVHRVDWHVAEPIKPKVDGKARATSELRSLIASLAGSVIGFIDNTEPTATAAAELDRDAGLLKQAQSLADTAQVNLKLRIEGYNDASGRPEHNADLRRARANWLRDRLRERGVDAALLDNATLSTDTNQAENIRAAKVRLQAEEEVR